MAKKGFKTMKCIQGSRDKLELEMIRILLTQHDEQGQIKFDAILKRLQSKGKLALIKK